MNKFIKKLIKQLSSWHALVLIVIVLIGAPYLYFNYFSLDVNEGTTESNTTINEAPKTEEEAIVDGIIEGVEIVSELGGNLSDNKKIKDSIYEANRAQYWVYMIGDYADSKESILRAYNQIESDVRDDVKVFQSRDKSYMLFVKPSLDNTQSAFISSIDSFKEKLGDDIEVVNLISGKRCDKVVQVDDLKKKIDKKKIIAPCFVCD